MKRILSFLFMAAAMAAQAAHVQFDLTDFVSGAIKRRVIYVTPLPAGEAATNATGIITADSIRRFTDTSGQCVVSNMASGLYTCLVYGPETNTAFNILVPDYAGLTNAFLLVTESNTDPSTLAGYTQSAANALFVLKTNGWSTAQILTDAFFKGSTNVFQHTNGAPTAGRSLHTDGTNAYWASDYVDDLADATNVARVYSKLTSWEFNTTTVDVASNVQMYFIEAPGLTVTCNIPNPTNYYEVYNDVGAVAHYFDLIPFGDTKITLTNTSPGGLLFERSGEPAVQTNNMVLSSNWVTIISIQSAWYVLEHEKGSGSGGAGDGVGVDTVQVRGFALTDKADVNFIAGSGLVVAGATVANTNNITFSLTNLSAGLIATLDDETGTGGMVFSNFPVMYYPSFNAGYYVQETDADPGINGLFVLDTNHAGGPSLRYMASNEVFNVVATTDTPGPNEIPKWDATTGRVLWQADATALGGGDGLLNVMTNQVGIAIGATNIDFRFHSGIRILGTNDGTTNQIWVGPDGNLTNWSKITTNSYLTKEDGSITNAYLTLTGANITNAYLTLTAAGITNAYLTLTGAGITNAYLTLTAAGITNAYLTLANAAITNAFLPTNLLGGTVDLGSPSDNDRLVWDDTSKVWTNKASSGGSPGGANTMLQWNQSGVFAGTTNMTWDIAANTLYAPTVAVERLIITNSSSLTPGSAELYETNGVDSVKLLTVDQLTTNVWITLPTNVISGLAWFDQLSPTTMISRIVASNTASPGQFLAYSNGVPLWTNAPTAQDMSVTNAYIPTNRINFLVGTEEENDLLLYDAEHNAFTNYNPNLVPFKAVADTASVTPIDMATNAMIQEITVDSGDITLITTNRASYSKVRQTATCYLLASGAARTITFDTNWKVAGTNTTSAVVPQNAYMILNLKGAGTAETDIIATYTVTE